MNTAIDMYGNDINNSDHITADSVAITTSLQVGTNANVDNRLTVGAGGISTDGNLEVDGIATIHGDADINGNADVAGVATAGRLHTREYLQVDGTRSEEHTSELQSLMRISYAVFCLKHKKY